MGDEVIYINDPLESFCPDDVRNWLKTDYSEQHLADAYATTNNKVGWLMHEDDESNNWAVHEMFERWYELEKELINKIIIILQEENEKENADYVLEGGTHFIAKPFMERNGYRDGNGWWVEKEE